VPSIYASLWILQLVSPPDLRCFQQQHHRRLLKLFVLYLLTIDSDAALVSSTFENTHSLNSESRWLLPSDHLENSDFSPAARIVPAPKNDLPYQKYGTQTTQKILLEEYSFIFYLHLSVPCAGLSYLKELGALLLQIQSYKTQNSIERTSSHSD